jgi:hypothetical protein
MQMGGNGDRQAHVQTTGVVLLYDLRRCSVHLHPVLIKQDRGEALRKDYQPAE